MRVTYDADADAASVFFVDTVSARKVVRTEVCDVEIREGAVILLVGPDDRLAGLEILGAADLLGAEFLAHVESQDA